MIELHKRLRNRPIVTTLYIYLYFFFFQGKKTKLVAVGVGSGIDYSELNEIANGKAANVIHVDKFEDLFVRLNSVLRASCEVD